MKTAFIRTFGAAFALFILLALTSGALADSEPAGAAPAAAAGTAALAPDDGAQQDGAAGTADALPEASAETTLIVALLSALASTGLAAAFFVYWVRQSKKKNKK